MSDPNDIDEIAQLFIEESVEGLEVMESGLLDLSPGVVDPEVINGIFRAAHSIKGGGATFGFQHIADFAHHVETLLDEMRQQLREVTQEGVDLLLESVDCLRMMINALSDGAVDTGVVTALESRLEKMLAERQQESAEAAPAEAADEPVLWEIRYAPSKESATNGGDPLRLLEALSELGDIEVSCEGAEKLKLGNFDPYEPQLQWQISLTTAAAREDIEELLTWCADNDEFQVTAAQPAPSAAAEAPPQPGKAAVSNKPAAPAAAPKPSAAENNSIRVNTDKVDALINLVGELVITQSMLSRFHGDFDLDQLDALREGLAQLSRNTRELQESVMAIRMLPIGFAFSRFPRLVRDAGKALGKEVELKLTGESTELDKTVLEKISDPLVHLVRNSLDHGLESPEVRRAAGKPTKGVLELNAYHEGGNIVIEVIDDGAGINRDRVLQKAQERGLVGPDETLTDERIYNLIFMAGFSTAEEVSDLSGRGVGMDVVRRNIRDLNGSVSVSSEPGVGSRFTIRLPLTLAILDGQLVQVGDQSYIIPLVSIVETVQMSPEYTNDVAGSMEIYRLRDDYLPILRLHEMFDVETANSDTSTGLLVVAESNGQRIGILVDDLLEQQQVVIKSLDANFKQTQGVSGATILGDGAVALILDVPGLMNLFMERDASKATAA